MAVIAELVTKQTESARRDTAAGPTDSYELEALFADIEDTFGDIAEIINDNFILEVEDSRRVGD
jgi:hypothetical protein